MSNLRFSVLARNAGLNATVNLLNAGPGPATLKIYTGPLPATPETAITTQDLLGTLVLDDPAFGVAAAGEKVAGAITPDTAADMTGLHCFARLADSTGVAVLDAKTGFLDPETGLPDPDAAINFPTDTLYAGLPVEITSFSITWPVGD
jgi:hypothetical protein